MAYQLPDGSVVQKGQSFKLIRMITVVKGDATEQYEDQIQYPWNWLECASPEDLAEVGIIEVPDPLPPAPTEEQMLAAFTNAVQLRLDDFARTRGYDGILSACTYANSAVPKFAAEGQYCLQVRDATWAKCYEILGAVQALTRPMPTEAQAMAELPVLVWPN